MRFLADLHLHSHYSSGASSTMIPGNIIQSAVRKGLKLIGTGDCLCFRWIDEIEDVASFDKEKGLFFVKGEDLALMLTTEVNLRFFRNQTHQIHFLLSFGSTLDVLDFMQILEQKGFGRELFEEGRPTIEMELEEFLEITRQFQDTLVIPAHYLTPWFGLLGSRGFEKDIVSDLQIDALETGLSSTPEMGRLIEELDRLPLVSFSDAHSPQAIGREATAFSCELSYKAIVDRIRANFIIFTVEYPPEKGKSYWSGPRYCNTSSPLPKICPLCGKMCTEGVLARVKKFSEREEPITKPSTVWHLPLSLLLEYYGYKGISFEYPEFDMMLYFGRDELEEFLPQDVVSLIMALRRKDVPIEPGYDGKFGELPL